MKANQDREQVRKEIAARIAEILNMDASKINPSTPLIAYNMDSLTFFNVSFELEEKYGINLIEENVTMDVSLDGLIDVICKKESV